MSSVRCRSRRCSDSSCNPRKSPKKAAVNGNHSLGWTPSKLPGPSSHPYSPKCVEGEFSEAWKENSPKFAGTEFSEVRTRLGPVASCLWWKGSSRPSGARVA
jgi:hypothetical protein